MRTGSHRQQAAAGNPDSAALLQHQHPSTITLRGGCAVTYLAGLRSQCGLSVTSRPTRTHCSPSRGPLGYIVYGVAAAACATPRHARACGRRARRHAGGDAARQRARPCGLTGSTPRRHADRAGQGRAALSHCPQSALLLSSRHAQGGATPRDAATTPWPGDIIALAD